MSREPVPTLYRCPRCYRVAQWTDGTSVGAGDERDEFWCQTCGEEIFLEAMEVVPAAVVTVELLDALAKAALALTYTSEGIDIWWRNNADMDPVERAREAYAAGEMIVI